MQAVGEVSMKTETITRTLDLRRVIPIEAVKEDGPWLEVATHNKPPDKRRTTQSNSRPQHESSRRPSHHKDSRRSLRGLKAEKTLCVYIENIEVMEEESNDDIITMVRKYAALGGLRTMSERVIRNKFYTDVVGCKVNIPASQVRLASSPDFWPKVVSCRLWEYRQKRNPRNYDSYTNSRYRDDEYDDRDALSNNNDYHDQNNHDDYS